LRKRNDISELLFPHKSRGLQKEKETVTSLANVSHP
jgi:hypothetical protein